MIEQLFKNYIEVGTTAYNQHYLHLWKNENSIPYIKRSFKLLVLKREMKDANIEPFVIKNENTSIGILKLDIDAKLNSYGKKEALLLDKINILKEPSGKVIGKEVLDLRKLERNSSTRKFFGSTRCKVPLP